MSNVKIFVNLSILSPFKDLLPLFFLHLRRFCNNFGWNKQIHFRNLNVFCYVTPHLKGHLFFLSYNRIQDWWSDRSSLDIENVVLQIYTKLPSVCFFYTSQLELSSSTSLYIGYSTKCFFENFFLFLTVIVV